MTANAQRTMASGADHVQLLTQAEQAWRAGRPAEALELCRTCEETGDAPAALYGLQGDIYAQLGNLPIASSLYERAIAMDASNGLYVLKAGQVALTRQDLPLAETLLKRAVDMQPNAAAAWKVLIQLYMLRNQPDAALDALEKMRIHDTSPEADGFTAIVLMRFGDVAQAENFVSLLASRDANYPRLPFFMGKLQFAKQRYDTAEPLLLEACRRDARDHEARYALALLYWRTKRLQQAHESILQALAIAPNMLEYDFFLVRLATETFQFEAAEQLLTMMHMREPEHMLIVSELCSVYLRLEKFDQAKALTEKLMQLNPSNEAYAHQLAAIEGKTTAASPDAYVRNLFDHYSTKFDDHLVGKLAYHTPQAIADIVLRVLKDREVEAQNLSLLDLGCGTGLSAEVLANHTTHRVGVDLSPKMLAQAEQKNLYASLHAENIVEYCARDAAQYDLVTAMDVFVYIGDLDPIFAGMKARVTADGLIAFSVENGDDAAPYVLRKSMRYAHAAAYIESLAKQHSLTIVAKEATVLRKEQGKDMQGYLYVLSAS
jgi:predicted TPR repeat methyltransferase